MSKTLCFKLEIALKALCFKLETVSKALCFKLETVSKALYVKAGIIASPCRKLYQRPSASSWRLH
jgi:hypothetical protein